MATLLIEFPSDVPAAQCERFVEPIREALQSKLQASTVQCTNGLPFRIVARVGSVDEATRAIRTTLLQRGAPPNTMITQSLEDIEPSEFPAADVADADLPVPLESAEYPHVDVDEIVDLVPAGTADVADDIIDAEVQPPADASVVEATLEPQPADDYEVSSNIIQRDSLPTEAVVEVIAVPETQPSAVDARVPWAFGVAFGLGSMFAGSICFALGWSYTIQRVPAPWFGTVAIAFGLWMLLFPRSRLVQRTFDNIRQIRD